MVKLGNILVNNRINNFGGLFNVVDDMSMVDNSLPLLIIGYEKASDIIKNFSILQKEYNNGMLQWTFSKTERRSDYCTDL